MGFTLKSSYALRALYELAVSTEGGKEKLSLIEIVEKNDIPRDFLEKIFGELRQAGIIKAIRGRYGGYALAKPPSEILIKDIILELDNPMNSYVCIKNKGQCEKDPDCTIKFVWFKMYNAMMRELGQMTLADLVAMGSNQNNFPDKLSIQ